MINFFKRRKKPIIEFYCHPSSNGAIPEPVLASKRIPDWFKRIKPHSPDRPDRMGRPGLNAKKCMPLLDAMSLGYIIPLAADLGIKTNSDCSVIELKNNHIFKCAEFHDVSQIGGKQAPGYPANPIKFINHWCIKTQPGWSTLFLPLINDVENDLFTCFGGLVDTDTFPREINFPAIWHKGDYDNFLTAGTPLVVAIPIHRSTIIDVKDPHIRKMTDEEFKYIELTRKKQESRNGVYTHELREPRK